MGFSSQEVLEEFRQFRPPVSMDFLPPASAAFTVPCSEALAFGIYLCQ